MEFNIKFNEQMIVEAANRVLDEFEYNGKTIREWADTLAHPKSNGDRIRAMTDEELADLYMRAIENEEYPGWWGNRMGLLAWLKQEAKDDGSAI